MTTTLRPVDGPERVGPRRARRRTYAVCANGRPIGTVRLADRSPWGEPCGWIEGLRVDPERRRRGHGSVAVLAAEEILREWGCRLAMAVLTAPDVAARLSLGGLSSPRKEPVGDAAHGSADEAGEGAHALFAGLGYVLGRQYLAKELGSARRDAAAIAHPRAGLRLRSMRGDEIGRWFGGGSADAQRELNPRSVLRVLAHGRDPVAAVWAEVEDSGRVARIRAVEAATAHRGRGYAGAALALAESGLAAAGAATAVVELAGEDLRFAPACERRGYEVAASWMTKPLA